MGNAPSNQGTKRKPTKKQAAWTWEFKDGRAYIKPRAQAEPQPRPLFRKRPSNNYNLWIFNPDPPSRRNSVNSKRSNSTKRLTK